MFGVAIILDLFRGSLWKNVAHAKTRCEANKKVLEGASASGLTAVARATRSVGERGGSV